MAYPTTAGRFLPLWGQGSPASGLGFVLPAPSFRPRRPGASMLMQPMIRRVPRVRAAGVEPERGAHRGPLEGTTGLPRPISASSQTARAISGQVCDCSAGPGDPVALRRESRRPV